MAFITVVQSLFNIFRIVVNVLTFLHLHSVGLHLSRSRIKSDPIWFKVDL